MPRLLPAALLRARGKAGWSALAANGHCSSRAISPGRSMLPNGACGKLWPNWHVRRRSLPNERALHITE